MRLTWLVEPPPKKNWHQHHKEAMRAGDRFAEWMSCRIGSPLSIFLHTAAFVACFEAWLLGEVWLEDMLLWLTTIVFLEAIYIGLFLQNSANRHGDANEHQAAENFRVNQEAKIDIEELMRRLSRMEDEKLSSLRADVSVMSAPPTVTMSTQTKPDRNVPTPRAPSRRQQQSPDSLPKTTRWTASGYP
jgi:uncharacterized membrane protein